MGDVKNPNEHYGKKYLLSLNKVTECYSYSHGFKDNPDMELHKVGCNEKNDKCLTVNVTINEAKASWLGCASDYCKITENPCNINNIVCYKIIIIESNFSFRLMAAKQALA
uniref:SCP domain-containing protein n=1 Tax=Strongyloides papillosus TaxID=174720 RepID=A0A0N5BL98_STREA